MKLYVIRHGQTIENLNGITQGQLPGHLSDLGKQQAIEAAQALSDIDFDEAWASDLKRTVDTAKIVIKPYDNLKLQLSPTLREYSFGKQQGKPVDSWQWPKSGDPIKIHAPGGESAKDVAVRVVEFINNLLQTSPNNTILVVTHAGPIRILVSLIDKVPLGKIIEAPIVHAKPVVFDVSNPLKVADLVW